MRLRIRTAACPLILLLCTAGLASAQGVIIITEHERIIPLPRPVPQPQPPIVPGSYHVKELSVRANISDQVAQVQVSQSFVNTGSRQVEAQFVFPLPYDGAVSQLTLMVDGREYPAQLLPADKAREIYESIVRRSKDPALLEWIGTGMFQTSVFPVPPGAERKVTLSYTQLLRRNERLTDFLFPLSTAKYTAHPLERVEFTINLESAQELKSVYSPSHAINVERPDAKHAVVTYKGANEVPIADFRLFFDVAAEPVGASVISYRPSESEPGYFLLMASPQFEAPEGPRTAKNVILVIDRSGSMEGEKIEQAREALKFVVNNLREGDRFNLIAYDSSVESFRPELQPYDEQTRLAALGFANGLYAGGGTNIDAALQTALAQFAGVDGPSYLLFLTDGLPTVGETSEAKIVAASKQNNTGHVRLLNFGVGYDVNSRLLDRLARENSGQTEYVRPNEDIEVHVSRLYRKISAPVMTSLAIDFSFDVVRSVEQGPAVSRVYPAQLPDLFAGEQLILLGRYDTTGRAKVTLTGQLLGTERSFDFPAEFVEHSGDSSDAFVEKLWAMRRIGEIIDELDLKGRNEELIHELVSLSTKHGILTPYTSFLADDSGRELAAAERFRRADATVDRLSEASGVAGFAQRSQKEALRGALQAGLAPSLHFSDEEGAQTAPAASAAARDLETDAPLVTSGIRSVNEQTLYRENNVWVTPETSELDLERDADQITVVERFSDAYFELVRENTRAENELLSSQQAGERLLVQFRGRNYLIE